MLGVSPSTLSRRGDLELRPAGRQEQRVAPGVVIRLAHEYRKRIVDAVAFDLVEFARSRDVRLVPRVEAAIDSIYRDTPSPATFSAKSFLAAARDLLPEGLYAQVCSALEAEGASRGVIGAIRPTPLEMDEPSIAKRPRPSPVPETPVLRRARSAASVRV